MRFVRGIYALTTRYTLDVVSGPQPLLPAAAGILASTASECVQFKKSSAERAATA